MRSTQNKQLRLQCSINTVCFCCVVNKEKKNCFCFEPVWKSAMLGIRLIGLLTVTVQIYWRGKRREFRGAAAAAGVDESFFDHCNISKKVLKDAEKESQAKKVKICEANALHLHGSYYILGWIWYTTLSSLKPMMFWSTSRPLDQYSRHFNHILCQVLTGNAVGSQCQWVIANHG